MERVKFISKRFLVLGKTLSQSLGVILTDQRLDVVGDFLSLHPATGKRSEAILVLQPTDDRFVYLSAVEAYSPEIRLIEADDGGELLRIRVDWTTFWGEGGLDNQFVVDPEFDLPAMCFEDLDNSSMSNLSYEFDRFHPLWRRDISRAVVHDFTESGCETMDRPP